MNELYSGPLRRDFVHPLKRVGAKDGSLFLVLLFITKGHETSHEAQRGRSVSHALCAFAK